MTRKGKGKGKRGFVKRLVMIAPPRRSGMGRVLEGSHSFTCTPRVHPLTEWTIPVYAFPAEAGTHLPIPEGWKAELALTRILLYCWVPLTLELQWEIIHITLCPEKKTKCFFVIYSTELRRFRWNLVESFLNKFAAKLLNVFHLAWIMYLHIVKLKMLVAHVLPLSC